MEPKEEIPTYMIVDEQGQPLPVETITANGVEYHVMTLSTRRTLKKMKEEK